MLLLRRPSSAKRWATASLLVAMSTPLACSHEENGSAVAQTREKVGRYERLKVPPHMKPMVGADPVMVPMGRAGHRKKRVADTDLRPKPGRVGAFRVPCGYSHMNFDDPIVHPRKPGMAHLHAYFGNTRVHAHTTPSKLERRGRSTCKGGILDRSAYWVPAMLDGSTGYAVRPLRMLVYYKSGHHGVDAAGIRPIPRRLRMIAGTTPATPRAWYAKWTCRSMRGSRPVMVHTLASPTIPRDCPYGNMIEQVVHFPQCWDGKRLDSGDHRSHMAYAKDGCPQSHPVALPAVSYKVAYRVPRKGTMHRWRLASDPTGTTTPGGTNHADFVNAWDPGVQRTFVESCVTRGYDCGGRLLGNGQILY